MRKIPTVYVRDFTRDNGRYVTDEVTPGCEWVLAGEGTPTRKFDGTCVMLDTDGMWWARREVKPGKPFPAEFAAEETDPTTGKTVGWEPAINSSFWKYLREAIAAEDFPEDLQAGTYELCGPKVQGNPERFARHTLIFHDDAEDIDPDGLDPKTLVMQAGNDGWEGLVWHHPDGRMAKLKVRDLRP